MNGLTLGALWGHQGSGEPCTQGVTEPLVDGGKGVGQPLEMALIWMTLNLVWSLGAVEKMNLFEGVGVLGDGLDAVEPPHPEGCPSPGSSAAVSPDCSPDWLSDGREQHPVRPKPQLLDDLLLGKPKRLQLHAWHYTCSSEPLPAAS